MSLGAARAEDIGSWFPESLTKEVENGGSLYDGRAEQGVRVPARKGTGCTEKGVWISGLEDV